MSYIARFSFSSLFLASALVLVAGCKSQPSVVLGHDGGIEPDATYDGPVPDSGAPPDAFITIPDSGAAEACVRRATCTVSGGQYCRSINDGCGGILECGDCPAGQQCGTADANKHVCISADPNCKPLTCDQPGGRLCGKIGDGCGGPLDCGDSCPSGQSCGGGGTANVCGAGPGSMCKA